MYFEKEVSVAELRNLYHTQEYDIEISSPDGYQPIGKWFDKGMMPMMRVGTENYSTICAERHMIQLDDTTWVLASELNGGDVIITATGNEEVLFVEPAAPQQCYDFEVLHPNHRYWGDGISSHNSGKSYICSANLIRDAQRQGIFVVLIDTENALDESWLTALGVSTAEDKLLKVSLSMIDDVAKLISMFMKDYKDQPAEKRVKTLFVIDSLGMLLTPTDINQFESGDMKGDMGRKPKALAALVRNCVNMFGNYNVGMVCTNHTYGSQDPYNPDDKISGGCLVAGTNVTMADGSYKPIEKLELDDMVQTMFGAQPVTNLWHYQKTTVSLTLEDGSTIECSPEHKFLVNRFEGQLWVSANDLTEEDEILAV